MTELLVLAVVAVAAAGVLVVLGRLAERIEAVAVRLRGIEAANDVAIEAVAQLRRTAEGAVIEASQRSREVSRQLKELGQLTVDQAVILAEVRDDLVKKLPNAHPSIGDTEPKEVMHDRSRQAQR